MDNEANREILSEIEPVDQLKFKDKRRGRDRITGAQKTTGERDALVAMEGSLKGMPVVCTAFEFDFLEARWVMRWAKNLMALSFHSPQVCLLTVFLRLVAHECKKH